MALGLSEKQQAMRESGIGASEVAAVVGLAPGAIDVWQRKVGLAEPWPGNSITEFGHRIERVIAEAWAERHQEEGVRIYTPGTLRHPKYPWMLASPDRVVAPPGEGRPAKETWKSLLEIKTVFFSSSEFGEEGTDEVPEKYLVQVAWQLAVCDLPAATLVALVNGDYREFPIERDPELEKMLIDQVGSWWARHVEGNTPPPPDGSEQYAAYQRRRYGSGGAPPIVATPEAIDLVTALREAKARAKAAEKEEETVKQQLVAVIGEADGIDGLCTYRANKPSQKTDWEALALDLGANPGQVDEYTTTKPGARQLRLSKLAKGK